MSTKFDLQGRFHCSVLPWMFIDTCLALLHLIQTLYSQIYSAVRFFLTNIFIPSWLKSLWSSPFSSSDWILLPSFSFFSWHQLTDQSFASKQLSKREYNLTFHSWTCKLSYRIHNEAVNHRGIVFYCRHFRIETSYIFAVITSCSLEKECTTADRCFIFYNGCMWF